MKIARKYALGALLAMALVCNAQRQARTNVTDSGITKVLFEKLPTDMQKKFKFDLAKAVEWKSQQAELQQQAVARTNSPKKAEEERKTAVAKRPQEQLDAALRSNDRQSEHAAKQTAPEAAAVTYCCLYAYSSLIISIGQNCANTANDQGKMAT